MKKGFTLLEILIAVVIFSSVTLMAAGSLNIGLKVKDKVTAITQVQDETRAITEQLTREIEYANNRSEFTTQISSLCGNGRFCAALSIKNLDVKTGRWTEKTFMPSVDGQNLVEQVTDQDGATTSNIVNSERVKLAELLFYRQNDSPYVNIKIAFEEAGGSNTNQKISLGDSYLGKVTRFEINTTAVMADLI